MKRFPAWRAAGAWSAHHAQRGAAGLLGWLFPASCVLCDAPGAALCAPCRRDTVVDVDPSCPRCAVPLPAGDRGRLCGRCSRRLPAFDGTWAAALYEPPFDQVVRAFKYGAVLAHAPLLADLLQSRYATAAQAAAPVDVVIPVPLSRERMATRGFNQSIEIARILARRLDLPLDAGSVLRVDDTPPQASLAFDARRRNVRGAFAVPDARRRALAGRRVAVVDDVMTTGATLDELARTLKRAGVASDCNLVVARTP